MASVSNTKELESIITNQLKPNGFRKRGLNWYKRTDDTICVVNLQKSSYGGQYYINLGVFVTALDTSIDCPPEYECHIRERLTSIVPNRSQLEQALNLEGRDMDTKDRVDAISESIQKYGLPWLVNFATLDSIRSTLNADTDEKLNVFVGLKQFLGIASA